MVEGNLQRRVVESRNFRSRVTHEEIESSKLAFYSIHHLTNFFGLVDVRMDDESARAPLPNSRERVVRRLSVLVIMNPNFDAAFGQLQTHASPNPTRPTFDQVMLSR